jgi:hypothetical protein
MSTLARPTSVNIHEAIKQLGWAVSDITIKRDIRKVRQEWQRDRVQDLSDYMDRTLAELNAVIADCRRAITGGFRETTTVKRRHNVATTADGTAVGGLTLIEEERITNPAKPNTAAMAALIRALEHRDRLMGLLDAEITGEIRQSGSGRVFAFTMRMGSRLYPTSVMDAELAAALPANVDDDPREVIMVDDDGHKHSTTN